jgi:hypothetical protein
MDIFGKMPSEAHTSRVLLVQGGLISNTLCPEGAVMEIPAKYLYQQEFNKYPA